MPRGSGLAGLKDRGRLEDSRKLFLGNLPTYDHTERAALREELEGFGLVEDLAVMPPAALGFTFGFVVFERKEHAEAALETLDGSERSGRKIRVKKAASEEQSSVKCPTIKLKRSNVKVMKKGKGSMPNGSYDGNGNGDKEDLEKGGGEEAEKGEEEEAKKEEKDEEVRDLTDRVNLLEARLATLEKSPQEKGSADFEKKKKESDQKEAGLNEKLGKTITESDQNRKSLEAKLEKLSAEQRKLQEDLLRVVEHCQEFENSLYKAQKTNEELVREMEDMKTEAGDTRSVFPESASKVPLSYIVPQRILAPFPLPPPFMPLPLNPNMPFNPLGMHFNPSMPFNPTNPFNNNPM